MTRTPSLRRRLLIGTILLGSSILLAASAPAHAQQTSAAAPTTSGWFIATYLPEAPTTIGVAQMVSLAGLHSRPARAGMAGETTEAWYIGTYLQPSAAATTGQSFALATLRALPAHHSPVRGSEAWYRATYLGQPARQ